jgi:Zn-dependent M28 family amino/carboxypeptidase
MRLLFILLLLLPRVAAASEKESDAAVEARLTKTVKFLASDELEGRGVGTEGLNKAALYLADRFQQLGLETKLFDGAPFQTFTVTAKTELGAAQDNSLTLIGPPAEEGGQPQRVELKLGEDFTPLAIGGSGVLEDELVFVGYGITADDMAYDDYAQVDVDGKVLVMLRKEPQQGDAESKFNGQQSSRYATFREKVSNAVEHGAAAIIIVNDNFDLVSKAEAEGKQLATVVEKLANRQVEFQQIDDPTDEQLAEHLREVQRLSEQIGESAQKLQRNQFDRLLRFDEAGTRGRESIPAFFATRANIDPVLKAALGKDLATLEHEIDTDLQPRSASLAPWTALGRSEVVVQKSEVKNVVGVLKGEGPLAEETVIVGAHYDHLGMGGPGTFAPWTVAVHNGADDNASGVAVLLEVAHRLAARHEPPRRRIVFIAFTGEERGLLGSAHYVKNPRFPLDQTVAMINMDMVGRLDENKLTIYGTGTAAEFDGLIELLNVVHEFDLAKRPGGFGPSDHASFYPKKIPVLHLFTGMHADYHRPGDDWEKVNFDGMRRVADLVADIVEAIADADQRPSFRENNRRENVRRTGEWQGASGEWQASVARYSPCVEDDFECQLFVVAQDDEVPLHTRHSPLATISLFR